MKVQCIFGPPGCGKTQFLINTANESAHTQPRVLFLSFTKAAAAEAASRIQSDRIIPSTLHSYAFKSLGLTSAQVVDEKKLESFAAIVGTPIKTKDEDALQIGDEYFDVISYSANRLISIEDAYDEFGRPGTPREFRMFVRAYDDWKATYGYMDFDDMMMGLLNTDQVSVPPVIILDEAQDCSPLQWAVFTKLSKLSKFAYVAGDDDQAIYEWSGADPHGMVDFASKWDANVRVLEQSHRMPPSVHEFVHDFVLREFGRRQEKKFHPRIEGGADLGVVRYGTFMDVPTDSIGEHETLILARDRFRMLDAKKTLNAHTIPYRVAGGSSPFDNVKVNAIRGMIKLNMGEQATQAELRSLSLVLQTAAIMKGDYSAVMGKQWQKDIPMTRNQVEFYSSIDLFAPIRTTISTIHQAKGREADRVIVDLELTPRVVENIIRNRDAELRVMYVACTRAREALSLCAENPLI